MSGRKSTHEQWLTEEALLLLEGWARDGMTDEQIAEAGLQALKAWMQEIGLPLTITQLGATEDMIPGITEGTICYPAGYLNLTKSDVAEILKESM